MQHWVTTCLINLRLCYVYHSRGYKPLKSLFLLRRTINPLTLKAVFWFRWGFIERWYCLHRQVYTEWGNIYVSHAFGYNKIISWHIPKPLLEVPPDTDGVLKLHIYYVIYLLQQPPTLMTSSATFSIWKNWSQILLFKNTQLFLLQLNLHSNLRLTLNLHCSHYYANNYPRELCYFPCKSCKNSMTEIIVTFKLLPYFVLRDIT